MTRPRVGMVLGSLLATLLCACTPPDADNAAAPRDASAQRTWAGPEDDAHRDARIAAWQRLGFGMFVHWGLYSELGGVWNGARVEQGYSEQIQGWAGISADDYARVAKRFDGSGFDAGTICQLAKDAGARYVVVTSKHHDGFAMFDTATTDYNIVDRTPFARDPLKLVAEACRARGLGFGVYFSLVDWHAGHVPETQHNSNPIPVAMEPLIEAQLRELMTNYGPIVEVWFDMSAPTPEQSRRFAGIVRELQPQATINGRIWNNVGDFVTLGDNETPPASMQPPFQVPASIYHATWGYRSWQVRDDLSGKLRELVDGLVRTRAAGGNYLLNIGPFGDGRVVPFETDVLEGIGAWLKRHAGVLDAMPSGLPPQPWGVTMRSDDGNSVLLFVRDWPEGTLRLSGLGNGPREVRLDGAGALTWRRDGGDVLIDLPATAPDPVSTVLRVSLSEPLQPLPAQVVAENPEGGYRIDQAQWQAGTSFAFGRDYTTQTTTTVSLHTRIASTRPQRLALRLSGAHADERHRYRIRVGEHIVEARGDALASTVLGPFDVPASPALPLEIRLQAPAYPAQDLALAFDAIELRPVDATSP